MFESLSVQNPSKMVGFNSSVGVCGVFENIKLNDSYAYNNKKERIFPAQEGQIFTDPELLRTIKR